MDKCAHIPVRAHHDECHRCLVDVIDPTGTTIRIMIRFGFLVSLRDGVATEDNSLNSAGREHLERRYNALNFCCCIFRARREDEDGVEPRLEDIKECGFNTASIDEPGRARGTVPSAHVPIGVPLVCMGLQVVVPEAERAAGVVHDGAPAVVDLHHVEGLVPPLREAGFLLAGIMRDDLRLEVVRLVVFGVLGHHVRVEAGSGDEHVGDDGEAFRLVGCEEAGGGIALVSKGKLPREVELRCGVRKRGITVEEGYILNLARWC